MKSVVITGIALFLAQSADAQIISQTPRPDVPDPEAASVETLTPKARIGQSGNTVIVTRAGALLFAGFDNNGDYIIDKEEVRIGIEQAFKRADRDGTGALSLVELEAWREKALGSVESAPTNFAFAPNFARSVSPAKFTETLQKVAEKLDADPDGNTDGMIAMSDLLKSKSMPTRGRDFDAESCVDRIRDERRRVEQQCRNSRAR